jgi:uncharacterized membrane protein
MDSHARSVAKTISWRIVATIITSGVVFAISFVMANQDKARFALLIGGLDTSIKFGIYFLHERIWNKIDYGRAVRPAEYEI